MGVLRVEVEPRVEALQFGPVVLVGRRRLHPVEESRTPRLHVLRDGEGVVSPPVDHVVLPVLAGPSGVPPRVVSTEVGEVELGQELLPNVAPVVGPGVVVEPVSVGHVVEVLVDPRPPRRVRGLSGQSEPPSSLSSMG